jgi:hypothetical protein
MKEVGNGGNNRRVGTDERKTCNFASRRKRKREGIGKPKHRENSSRKWSDMEHGTMGMNETKGEYKEVGEAVLLTSSI